MTVPRIRMLLGATASGKKEVAFRVARSMGAEILSLDSMKVYREMDIGAAKPSPAARREVPHHLLDLVAPTENFSTGRYVAAAGRSWRG